MENESASMQINKYITGMQLMESNKKLHSGNARDKIVSWTKGLIENINQQEYSVLAITSIPC